jgi:hypothetical protein
MHPAFSLNHPEVPMIRFALTRALVSLFFVNTMAQAAVQVYRCTGSLHRKSDNQLYETLTFNMSTDYPANVPLDQYHTEWATFVPSRVYPRQQGPAEVSCRTSPEIVLVKGTVDKTTIETLGLIGSFECKQSKRNVSFASTKTSPFEEFTSDFPLYSWEKFERTLNDESAKSSVCIASGSLGDATRELAQTLGNEGVEALIIQDHYLEWTTQTPHCVQWEGDGEGRGQECIKTEGFDRIKHKMGKCPDLTDSRS